MSTKKGLTIAVLTVSVIAMSMLTACVPGFAPMGGPSLSPVSGPSLSPIGGPATGPSTGPK